MKIGLVCPYNYLRNGGVQECIRASHERLKRMGHDVRVITPQPRGHDGECPEDVLFLGTSTNFNSPLATTTQLSVSVNDQEIIDLLESEHFDVIHFHEPWVPMISQQILKRSDAVHVATFHAKLPESVMSRTMARVVTPYTKSVLKYIDEFTAVSPAAAEYVHMLSDVPITFIPNGIDLKKYVPGKDAKKASEAKTILFFGRLERRKGVKYLVKAFAQLVKNHPEVHLIIGGDGPQRAKLEQMVEDLDIPNVTFPGFLSEADKLKLLQTVDIFCAPAIFGESFGIVLLEAMACGAVTVAGNNPGYEAVMKGIGKLSIVDPHHTSDLVSRLELLLYTDELRQVWQAWATEYVKQFDYDRVVEQYEQVYKKALAHREEDQ